MSLPVPYIVSGRVATERELLERYVWAHPAEEAGRLVLADWLTEHGVCGYEHGVSYADALAAFAGGRERPVHLATLGRDRGCRLALIGPPTFRRFHFDFAARRTHPCAGAGCTMCDEPRLPVRVETLVTALRLLPGLLWEPIVARMSYRAGTEFGDANPGPAIGLLARVVQEVRGSVKLHRLVACDHPPDPLSCELVDAIGEVEGGVS